MSLAPRLTADVRLTNNPVRHINSRRLPSVLTAVGEALFAIVWTLIWTVVAILLTRDAPELIAMLIVVFGDGIAIGLLLIGYRIYHATMKKKRDSKKPEKMEATSQMRSADDTKSEATDPR